MREVGMGDAREGEMDKAAAREGQMRDTRGRNHRRER